jgi:two-component system, sensor histidine kinase RegB
MDAPLLALTRRRTPGGAPPGNAAAENMRQLTQLRWMAVAGQTLTILFVHFALGVPLPLFQMLSVALVLAAANFAARITLPHHRVRSSEVMAALLLDMGALTLQLYFSGGATNPFAPLYLLQVALGAILLPSTGIVVLVIAAGLSYALLTVSYVPLALPQGLIADAADLFAIGRWIGFVLVAVLLVLFVTRISRNLNVHALRVADLRQDAAEEDGIVRMGLFASGAAHELGTPLGTLSVILADWRRVPSIAADPELAADVEAMQSEVQRCKAIVSDILHSAGQPRGEAMQSQAAEPFLDSVAAAWHATHAQVPLDYTPGSAGDVVIAADEALRQAVWNLLDNAAEASPVGVRLRAKIEENLFSIAVSDWGEGFTPDALAKVGKLYQSTKGAGHGVGLFLAANVARRLGGRLEARNRAMAGAEVRILLPLALPEERA